MRDHRNKTQRRIRLGGSWTMLVSLVVAMTGGILAAGFLHGASATLAGSSFNGLDAVVDTVGVLDITDPVQGADTTNYSMGSDEDTICPGVATGTAPNSDDLDHFYFGTEANASGVYLYLGWHRLSAVGDKTIDFELNQSATPTLACATGTPGRTAGDVLISYDFNGAGVVTLSRRIWVGTALAGAWSAPTTLVTGEEASVDATGSFGEMVINGTVSGMFTPGVCSNFASAYAKSHASNSFASQLKDFTAGVARTVSSCGSVVITKTDDAIPAQPVNGAVFGLFTDVAGVIGAAVPGKTCPTVAGTCTIDDITPAGTYWVRETSTPAGYATAPDQQVVVNHAPVPLTFVDNRLANGLSLTKTVNGLHPTVAAPLQVPAGSTLNYVVTVTNTGNVLLTVASLADTLKASLPATCTQGIGSTLAAGASLTCTYSAVADKFAHNVASASATDQFGRTATASDETFVSPIRPGLTLTKTAPSFGHVGDTVLYELAVVNSGNVGLTNVVPSDPMCSSAPALKAKTGGNQDAVLELGETWTYTCTHTVVAADGNTFVNKAVVSALDPLGAAVSASATHSLTVLHPGLAVDKTANPTSANPGDTVTFTYVVTNTGDTVLTNVTVVDNVLGAIATIPSLAPGASTTATKTMTVTSTSPTVNVATVKGTDAAGLEVSATDDATIAIILGEVLFNAPELPRTGAPLVGEVRLALLLLGLGGTLVFISRRRRFAA